MMSFLGTSFANVLVKLPFKDPGDDRAADPRPCRWTTACRASFDTTINSGI